jgi:hypothetical protein
MQDRVYVVFGTVELIDGFSDWWYVACACHKRVVPDGGMYYCERCQKHVLAVDPRSVTN